MAFFYLDLTKEFNIYVHLKPSENVALANKHADWLNLIGAITTLSQELVPNEDVMQASASYRKSAACGIFYKVTK